MYGMIVFLGKGNETGVRRGRGMVKGGRGKRRERERERWLGRRVMGVEEKDKVEEMERGGEERMNGETRGNGWCKGEEDEWEECGGGRVDEEDSLTKERKR